MRHPSLSEWSSLPLWSRGWAVNHSVEAKGIEQTPMPFPKRQTRQESKFQHRGLFLPLPLCPISLLLHLIILNILPKSRRWTLQWPVPYFPQDVHIAFSFLGFLISDSRPLHSLSPHPCPYHIFLSSYYWPVCSWVGILSPVLKGIPQVIEEFIFLCAQHRDLCLAWNRKSINIGWVNEWMDEHSWRWEFPLVLQDFHLLSPHTPSQAQRKTGHKHTLLVPFTPMQNHTPVQTPGTQTLTYPQTARQTQTFSWEIWTETLKVPPWSPLREAKSLFSEILNSFIGEVLARKKLQLNEGHLTVHLDSKEKQIFITSIR